MEDEDEDWDMYAEADIQAVDDYLQELERHRSAEIEAAACSGLQAGSTLCLFYAQAAIMQKLYMRDVIRNRFQIWVD